MKIIVLILVAVVYLAGCARPSPTLTPTDSPTPAIVAPERTAVVATKIPSTLSSFPSASSTQQTTASITPWVTPLALEKGAISEGTILLDPEGQGVRQEVIKKYQGHMVIPETFLTIQDCCLLLNIGTNMMSLDHRYASIIRYEVGSSILEEEIIVTDGDRQIAANLEKLQARDVAYWPTNTEVFLYPKEQLYPQGTLILYNPFTQQSRVISPTFPHLVDRDLHPVPNWYSAPNTPKYDPSLSRMVYYKSNLDKLESAVSLWNPETNTEIWRRDLKSLVARPWSSEPEWSPDGSRFAIFLPDAVLHKTLELTLVDRDGNEMILLDPKISRKITWGSGITWSPDGRYLSFYVQEKLGIRLLVYDFKLKQVWDPDLIELTDQERNGNPGGMIWSPDSKQFLVNNILPESTPFNYVVDVEKRRIYDFGYPFRVAVWLAPSE